MKNSAEAVTNDTFRSSPSMSEPTPSCAEFGYEAGAMENNVSLQAYEYSLHLDSVFQNCNDTYNDLQSRFLTFRRSFEATCSYQIDFTDGENNPNISIGFLNVYRKVDELYHKWMSEKETKIQEYIDLIRMALGKCDCICHILREIPIDEKSRRIPKSTEKIYLKLFKKYLENARKYLIVATRDANYYSTHKDFVIGEFRKILSS